MHHAEILLLLYKDKYQASNLNDYYKIFYEWSKFVEGYFNNENLVIIEKMPKKRKHLENVLLLIVL